MVDLSQLNSNLFLPIIKFKKSVPKEAEIVKDTDDRVINDYGETEVKRYRRNQQILHKSKREQIVEMYLNGVNTYTLAKAFHCHRTTISRIIKDAGITPTPEKLNLEDAIKLYESGWTTINIAKKYDMSDNAVSRRLKMAGIKMRTRWDYGK